MKVSKSITTLTIALTLTACVDDGEDGSNGINGINSLVNQVKLNAGDNQCFNGGIRIDTGFDANSNNSLDTNEVTSSEFICAPTIPSILANQTADKLSYPIIDKINILDTVNFSEGGRDGNSLDLSVGFGSGAYHYAGDPSNMFYTISDRGPNIKCDDAESVFGLDNFCQLDGETVDGKIFPVESFSLSIYQWMIVENSLSEKRAELKKIITLKDQEGNEITGISNPLIFDDGTSNTENAFASSGSPLAYDPEGLDPEALIKLSDGTYWIAEEYGASILHIAADGRVLNRVVPAGIESQLEQANYPVEGKLPSIYHKRKLNRGIESIAVSPDENYLYFIMQSPLQNPDYRRSRHVRIMKYTLSGGTLGDAVGEYVYVIDAPETFGDGISGDNGKKQKDVKISEMVAIEEDQLIVLERINKTTKLYRINLASAQNIVGTSFSSHGIIANEADEMKTLEDIYNLNVVDASPVYKSLVFNSLIDAPDLPKKIEGVAMLDSNYVMLINDNDFGIEGLTTEINVLRIGERLKDQKNNLSKKPEFNLVARYQASTTGEGAAEIVQYHPASQSIFTINGDVGNRIEVVSLLGQITNPLVSPLIDTNLTGNNYDFPNMVTINSQNVNISDVNSIAIKGNRLAVAVAHANDIEEAGVVLVYVLKNDGSFDVNDYTAVRVGVLPDNVNFSPDGTKIIVANEGQAGDLPQNDQKGSVSIIDISGGVISSPATTLYFDEYNGVSMVGTNQNPKALDFAHAAEPEYVTVTADSKTAFVTLQEMNALAIVNLETKTIETVRGLGFKNHGLGSNALDASDKDNAVNIRSYDNLYGLYQPDTIVNYQVNGKTYLVTANEGDAGDGFQDVDERVEDLTLDATAFPAATELQTDNALGRLKVVPYLGQTENGAYEKLYAFGGRSFSIWDDTGTLVFDSGSDFEKITAGLFGINFNNDEDENEADTRSDAKGPEPEALAIGKIGSRMFAFIGMERMGGIAMYDITDPYGVQFIAYTNNRDFDNIKNGDLAPEGMTFVADEDSPTGYPLLIVGNEISGTVAVYQIQ